VQLSPREGIHGPKHGAQRNCKQPGSPEHVFNPLQQGTAMLPDVSKILNNFVANPDERRLMIAILSMVALFIISFIALTRDAARRKSSLTRSGFLQKERVSVPLIDKKELSHDVCRFRFGLPTDQTVLGLPVGQHITMYAPNMRGLVGGEWNKKPDPEGGEKEIQRKYTPVTSDDDLGYFDLVIKVYVRGEKDQFPDGGKMSQYLNSLVVGKSTVDIKGPIGRLQYMGKGRFMLGKKYLPIKKQIGMMAGGTGITPCLQVITAALKDPNDKTEISLLYANQTENDILVRDEMEALQKKHPQRFKIWYTLDRPAADWGFSKGFIDTEMIKAHLPPPSSDTIILMCGPPPMVKFACEANLEKLGYAKDSCLAF